MMVLNQSRVNAMTKIIRFASTTMAVAATSVALGISFVAGNERGGLPVERAIWIGVGLVLALSAHLIPALIGRQSIGRKIAGYGLWLACMLTTIGGHAQFFLQAQQHAGAVRAAAIEKPVAHGRGMIAILDEKAKTEQKIAAKQAFLKSRYCKAGCVLTQSEITGLQGHLTVLDAEKMQAAKDASNQDRYEAKAEQAGMDPVAVALAQFGIAPEKVQTLMSMAAALTLELVACLFWSLSLSPVKARQKQPATAPGAAPMAQVAASAPVAAVFNAPDWKHAVQIPVNCDGTEIATDEPVAAEQESQAEAAALPIANRVRATMKRAEHAILSRFGGTQEAIRLVNRVVRGT